MVDFFVTKNMQFYLRIISVFIGVMLNARWFTNNYPAQNLIFPTLISLALAIGTFNIVS